MSDEIAAAMPTISQTIWDMKYRLKQPSENGQPGAPIDRTLPDTWRRVARALAAPEAEDQRDLWEAKFFQAMEGFKFMPGGRIIAGAGSGRAVSLFNCFTMGTIPDSMAGIFAHLREAALTMQQGGGIGYDFSTLRPKGAPVHGVGADASGPLSFMDCWDAMCRTVESAGYRRGAMMATLRCDHPDIESFIEAKADRNKLRMFNLSVLVTDPFMTAVEADDEWPLQFNGRVFKVIRARELWNKIMRSTYAYAEPGVIFIDRINFLNNLWYCEQISTTNPCGEQPMGPYSSCLLGSINLARLVQRPFTEDAIIDVDDLRELTGTAFRMLDNVIDVSRFPLPQQLEDQKQKRRIGLGVTGLADALIMCGLRYGSPEAIMMTERWLSNIEAAAYLASTDLAAEKGPFPLFDRDKYLAGEHIKLLNPAVREAIAEKGIRNSHVTSIAPTGTISQFGFNVSSGIEPVFSVKSYRRTLLMPDGSDEEHEVADWAVTRWRQLRGAEPLPDYFVDAQTLAPQAHLDMMAAAQKYIDSSISKTINLPEDIPFEAFKDVYLLAYEKGCKSCTTYRPNEVTGSILSISEDEPSVSEEERAAAEAFFSDADANVRIADFVDVKTTLVQLTPPLPSPDEVEGTRYRIRWPDSNHALYVILTDIEEHGRKRPWEVFLISNEAESDEWRVALGRMISAVYRRGGDVAFLADELRAISDKKGGAFLGGKHIPSIIAAIGDVIQRHMEKIGFVAAADRQVEMHLSDPAEVAAVMAGSAAPSVGYRAPRGRQCPRCGQFGLIRWENCDRCPSCGYDKCG